MSYFVFREGVDPSRKHAKVLPDGTIIRGGYEAAYQQNPDGLKWAKQCAKRVGGAVYVKTKQNQWVKTFIARNKNNKSQTRRAA